jgi:hypothetical protein
MDNVLAMWVAFAFAAILSSDAARLRGSVFAGLFLAAAVATKLMTIVFLLPLMIGLVLCDRSCQFSVKPSSDASAQRRFLWMKISLLSLPALVVVCLWEIWFFRATGHWLPDWLAIDDAVLRKHPFMAARADQPPLYFPAKFFLLCPLALLVVVPASARVFKFGGQGKAILKTTLLAIVLYLAVLVYLGERGFSKEARYLTPVMPLLGMLFADGLAHLAKRQLRTRDQIYLMACVLAILAGAMLSGFYLFVPSVDEPLSAWGLLFGTW